MNTDPGNANSANTGNMNTNPGNISIGSIKRQARERLLGHWSEHTSYSILLLMLEILCGMLGSMFTQNTLMSAVFALGISSILQLLMGLFYAGAKLHFLKSFRSQPSPLGDIVVPFKTHPDRFLITGFVYLLTAILLSVPVMLAGYLFPAGGAGLLAFTIACTIVCTLIYLFFRARWALSTFLLLEDPNLGAIASLRISAAMMKGHTAGFVKMILSFIGYGLLSICSFGLGFIWTFPYVLLSISIFYESVRSTTDSSTL